MQSQQWKNDLCSFPRKPFNITVIQVSAPTSNAKEAEVERFYEDLQDLVELTPKKDVLFIIGDWNAKVGSQETPGLTGKFDLGIQNEAGQRLKEFCQENVPCSLSKLLVLSFSRKYFKTSSWFSMELKQYLKPQTSVDFHNDKRLSENVRNIHKTFNTSHLWKQKSICYKDHL